MNNYIPVDQMRRDELREMLKAWEFQLLLKGVKVCAFLHPSSLSPIPPFVLLVHRDTLYLNLEVTQGRITATFWNVRTDKRVKVVKTLVSEALREIYRVAARFC
jgi:hypothetical protein